MTKPKPRSCMGCGAALFGRGGRDYCGPDCRPRCSVEECVKPVHAKGMCSAHVTRAARHGDPLAPLVRQPNQGDCSVPDCSEPMRKVGLCASHYSMQRRHGEIRDWQYKHGEGGYVPTHSLLRRTRGPAADLTCVDCGKPANEWSYGGGDPGEVTDDKGRTFTRNLAAYSPRCFRCHRHFDENPIAMRHRP